MNERLLRIEDRILQIGASEKIEELAAVESEDPAIVTQSRLELDVLNWTKK